jgi:hypothetical protein
LEKILKDDVNEITINGVTYVPKGDEVTTRGMKYCIVRCKNAGVHAGFVRERNEFTLTLVDSRRLYRYWSKFTLSGLATAGVLEGKEGSCMFACVVPVIELTCSDVCEVIPCSEKAFKSIKNIPEHTNE